MKIISLLPSATEIVFALGLGEQLCGVSFECDYPAAARSVPVVSGTALPTDGSLSAQGIDTEVSTRIAAGESIYTLDDAQIREIDPDLILAQDLCQVCAVPSGAVEDALAVIGCTAQVVSLDPGSLDEVIDCFGVVGAATGTEPLAEMLITEARQRVEEVRRRVNGRPRPRVLVLEWPDPPFNAGHWVPDMVEAAGGISVLASGGQRSHRLTWEQIASEAIDITVFAPCGFDLEGAVTQAESFIGRPEAAGMGQIYAVDANAYFSRPGPRVVDGVELLGELLHPRDGAAPSASSVRLLQPLG